MLEIPWNLWIKASRCFALHLFYIWFVQLFTVIVGNCDVCYGWAENCLALQNAKKLVMTTTTTLCRENIEFLPPVIKSSISMVYIHCAWNVHTFYMKVPFVLRITCMISLLKFVLECISIFRLLPQRVQFCTWKMPT